MMDPSTLILALMVALLVFGLRVAQVLALLIFLFAIFNTKMAEEIGYLLMNWNWHSAIPSWWANTVAFMSVYDNYMNVIAMVVFAAVVLMFTIRQFKA